MIMMMMRRLKACRPWSCMSFDNDCKLASVSCTAVLHVQRQWMSWAVATGDTLLND